MRKRHVAGLMIACLLGMWNIQVAWADGWGGLVPGSSVQKEVRDLYGPPSKETKGQEEGYATVEWTYEGGKTPEGLTRVVIAFGLLTPKGYRPEVVRSITIYPKPRIYTVEGILQGWGEPDRLGTEAGSDKVIFFYKSGFLARLDTSRAFAEYLLYTVEQPIPK